VRAQDAEPIFATSGFGGLAGFEIDPQEAQLRDDLAADIGFADIGIGAGYEIAAGVR
jgi:hypothetical protein